MLPQLPVFFVEPTFFLFFFFLFFHQSVRFCSDFFLLHGLQVVHGYFRRPPAGSWISFLLCLLSRMSKFRRQI